MIYLENCKEIFGYKFDASDKSLLRKIKFPAIGMRLPKNQRFQINLHGGSLEQVPPGVRSNVSAKTPATGCPLERPTQVVGSGKTRFTAAFFMPDVTHSRGPGALIVFKEREAERKANVASFGFNLAGLGRLKRAVPVTPHSQK